MISPIPFHPPAPWCVLEFGRWLRSCPHSMGGDPAVKMLTASVFGPPHALSLPPVTESPWEAVKSGLDRPPFADAVAQPRGGTGPASHSQQGASLEHHARPQVASRSDSAVPPWSSQSQLCIVLS